MQSLITTDDAPWKQRFRAPVIDWTSPAAAEPSRGLAAGNQSGVIQLYAWDRTGGDLRRLTDKPTGQSYGMIAADGRYIYYHDDTAGNEIGQYVRVPFEGGPAQQLTPGLPDYPSFSMDLSRRNDLFVCTLAGDDGYHVYAVPLGPGETIGTPRRIHHSPAFGGVQGLSADGGVVIFSSSEHSGKLQFELLALDAADGRRVAELSDGPETSIEGWGCSPRENDPRVLAMSNRTGTGRPLLWNYQTGERTDLSVDGLDGDIRPVAWSEDAERVLLCQVHHAVQQLYLYEIATETLTRLEHPAGTFAFGTNLGTYFGPDGEIFAQWQDATHPSRLIVLDGRTGAYRRTILAAGDVPGGRPFRSISFTSSDGQSIQGWLAVPAGDGPFPTLLHMIGGPGGVELQSFAPGAQAWLDHGFAYLTINYRGCSTFGRAFEEQIWGDVGHWEVEDMAAAHAWLVRQGIARPGEILLTGESYGGFLTLMGLGKRPDLWAGGMAIIAIADWTIQYEDTAGTLRGLQVALLGGTPQEKPEQYAASSPITYAERIAAPVLVIQGRNDTRCPARPMELYEARLRSLGKQIEVEWFDSGHGSLDTEQNIAHQERMLSWAYRVLS